MKKLSLILIIVVILVFIILLTGYSAKASFQKYKSNEIDKNLLQSLITKRTEIMNNSLYNCNNIELTIEQLKNIEKNTILENDILVLKEVQSNPTDYARVTNVRIKDILDIKVKDDIYEIISNIEWDISYNLEDYTEEHDYIIQIAHHDGQYYLVDFRLQNRQ